MCWRRFPGLGWGRGVRADPSCAVLEPQKRLSKTFLATRRVPDRWTLAVLVVPIAVSALASAARLFPLEGRVALWTGPSLLIVSAAGIDALTAWLPTRFRVVAPAAGVIWAGTLALLVAMTPPPYGTQAMRPVLETVPRHAQAGDAFYVYYGARHAMRFYGPGLGLNEWIPGGCHRGDTPTYYREVDQLRGRSRVWFIHTHALVRYREPEAIRSYLAAIRAA